MLLTTEQSSTALNSTHSVFSRGSSRCRSPTTPSVTVHSWPITADSVTDGDHSLPPRCTTIHVCTREIRCVKPSSVVSGVLGVKSWNQETPYLSCFGRRSDSAKLTFGPKANVLLMFCVSSRNHASRVPKPRHQFRSMARQ